MKARSATTRITLAAGIVSLTGPTCAVLSETDHLRLFPSSPLVGIWLLAAIGAIGVGVGVFAFCNGSKIAGTVCFLTNFAVLVFYGFIAVFFATGGTR